MGGVMKDEEKLNRALCKPGSKVYYWEEQHAWAIGIVEADDGKFFKVKGDDYSCTKVDALKTVDKCTEDKIWPVREDVLDEDTDDLLSLTVLHDATIQRCLYVRYMKDTCYTNIGAITVALNPWNFKIPKYVDAKMPDYLAEGDRIRNNVPHSWAQAHNTWNELREDSMDQCVLISGESGAGKTEAAKIVMKYLGALSCRQGTDQEKDAAKKVAFNINQASPVLEGFGNAKTVRNDNSSRFGKFMKIQFDAAGFLVGAFTTKYLLEKSRIITANPNERIYHAFYLLTKGKDAGKYNVKGPGHYQTTCNAGKCIDIPKVDDGEDYSICVDAMKDCGFNDDQIDGTWRMCAGALQLGTVQFKEIDKDTCDFIDKSGIGDACTNWMTDAAVLEKELMTTTMVTRDGPVVKKLNKDKSTDSRDSLVRTTYDNLFGWQVLTINARTDSGTGQNFIGLLDIFGFEDFEYNSFEQLCINLANETLQNHYNNYIFTKDMDECRAEGVDVAEVKCPDNMPCLTLMTAKTGVFGKLDDESNMGSGTDAGFLDKVKEQFDGKHPFFGVKRMSKDSFIVHHYAASVNYTVENWLEKNRDALKPDLKRFMRASAQPLLKEILPEPDESAKKITVGGFFKQQLTEMMDLINSTNPHWIRCVKPHPAKKPLMLHGITCMGQLESSGVLGTVKIRKAGFPVRPEFKRFVARFKSILPQPYPSLDGEVEQLKEFSRRLCDECGIDRMRAQAGKTKMFLKNDAAQCLEAKLDEVNRRNIATVQRYARANTSLSLCAFKRTKLRFNLAAAELQRELRDWLTRSAAVRQQREEERKRREATLREVSAMREVAEKRIASAGSGWEVPAQVQPMSAEQEQRVEAAAAKLRGSPGAVPQLRGFAVPALESRREGEDWGLALAKAWYNKSGDVLDELLGNLKGPASEGEQLSTLSILSEVCHQLRVQCGAGHPGKAMVSLFGLALQTMEPADIDRALGFADAPTIGTPEWDSYPPSARNASVHSELQQVGSPGASGFAKWTKLLALLIAVSAPLQEAEAGLVRHAVQGPDQLGALRQQQGKQLLWPAPARCSAAGTPAPSGTTVTYIIAGLREGISVGDFAQHPSGPPFIVPPLSIFSVTGIDEGDPLVVHLQARGQLHTSDQVLRDLCRVALSDAELADSRLVKVREKLMERKIAAEKERQRQLVEMLRDKLEAITGPQEKGGRRAVVEEEEEERAELFWIAAAQAAVYYEHQLLWCEEDEAAGRQAQRDREEAARRRLAAHLCSREAAVSLVDTEVDAIAARGIVANCEDLCRGETARRRKIGTRQIKSRSDLYAGIEGDMVELRGRAELRAQAMRKRDRKVQKLQRLMDDEFARAAAAHPQQGTSSASQNGTPPRWPGSGYGATPVLSAVPGGWGSPHQGPAQPHPPPSFCTPAATPQRLLHRHALAHGSPPAGCGTAPAGYAAPPGGYGPPPGFTSPSARGGSAQHGLELDPSNPYGQCLNPVASPPPPPHGAAYSLSGGSASRAPGSAAQHPRPHFR
eukprot:TRINITY_DN1139_c0_g1_i5.p1 TRINITY_DN1139_c0_g1~~TRINITY_DN1139_c0_g1_i5.p1  ORF type:complete len:1567 (+),score=593.71 TRINITY_DN1139_c0_g1_i5:150-4703(+)